MHPSSLCLGGHLCSPCVSVSKYTFSYKDANRWIRAIFAHNGGHEFLKDPVQEVNQDGEVGVIRNFILEGNKS